MYQHPGDAHVLPNEMTNEFAFALLIYSMYVGGYTGFRIPSQR
jgi:hypothetical protein